MSSEKHVEHQQNAGEAFTQSLQELIRKRREQGEPLTRFGLQFESPADYDDAMDDLYERQLAADENKTRLAPFIGRAATPHKREGDYNG